MTNIYNNDFIDAINDYYFLINKSYSKRVVLKIVSDRYRLNHDQRTILYRGIFCNNVVCEVKSKLTRILNDEAIYIDGFNVLFRIVHYLLGRPLFISNDGLLRDAGKWDEKLYFNNIFKDSLMLFMKYLNLINSKIVVIYMDNRFNLNDKKEFESIFYVISDNYINRKFNIIWSDDVDSDLKIKKESVVVTSDIEIILATKAKIFDLSRMILENEYHSEFVNISQFIM